MKKLILFIQILVFSCAFVACSSVEDNVIDGEDEATKAITIDMKTAGSMDAYLADNKLKGVESLVLTGEMNVLDFITLSMMPDLKILDMRDVRFVEYIGVTPHLDIENVYPANVIPLNHAASSIDEPPIIPYFPSLEAIELPTTVEELGGGAFASCKKLKSIVIPDNVQTLGIYVFADCSELESVVLPAKYKGNLWGTFCHCKNLKSINIPVGVREIVGNTFYGCESLQTIDLPEIMENDNVFGQFAFTGSSFKKIRIPKNVTDIGYLAFVSCPNLETIIFHENVKSLTEMSISYCPKLKNLEFVGPLEHFLATSLNYGCKLETLHLKNMTPPDHGGIQLYYPEEALRTSEIYVDCTLYVPIGAKAAYEASDAPLWKVFKAIVEE